MWSIRVKLFFLLFFVFTHCCHSLFNNWRSEYGFKKWRSSRVSFSKSKPKTLSPLEFYESRIVPALIAAPLILTVSSIIFSFPVVPLLLLAPIAFSNLSTLSDIRDVLSDEQSQTMMINILKKISSLLKLNKRETLAQEMSNNSNLSLSESQSVNTSSLHPLFSFSSSPSSSKSNSTFYNPFSPTLLSQLSSLNDILTNNQPSGK